MFDDEIWTDIYFIENDVIYDYRGLYQVSNYGRVKSFWHNKEKIMKPSVNTKGYLRINFYKNSKQKSFQVHRLVAHMFLSDFYFENAQVNHKDENKTNNHVDNLEWCDREYNTNYGTRNKRASEAMKGEKHPKARKIILIDPITMQTVFTWQYQKQATDFYGIGERTLSYYLKGKRKTGHLYNGFLFYYLEDWQQLNK